MSLEQLSDESVERYYESIRKQVEARSRAYKYQLTASPSVRERAEKLREEMVRRKAPALAYPTVTVLASIIHWKPSAS